MYKLDLVLIPLLYLFRMNLTLISVAIKCMPTSSKVQTTIRNAITWTVIIIIHLILFVLSDLHILTQIPIIQILLNTMEQSIIARTCLLWPEFYYSLFKPDKNIRTIWEIITSPVPPDGRKASKQSNRIPCLNATFSCFSSYQVQGAYAHLNQRHEQDVDEAVAAPTTLVFYNDPLRLAVPYVYILEMLTEPSNGLLKSISFLHLYL